MKEEKKPRLNEHLCPEDFEICVPLDCRLLTKWDTKELWQKYLKDLTGLDELPEEYKTCPPTCWSCDCQLGWKLKGEWALLHACRVHDKIHRQALGLDQVTAIDVGFAISERETRFWNFLAIRVHVNKKLPPEQLVRAGLVSLTDPTFARVFHGEGGDGRYSRFLLPDPGQKTNDNSLHPCNGLEFPGPVPSPCDKTKSCECPHPERNAQLGRILMQDNRNRRKDLQDVFADLYPISGIRPEDLSIFCPRSLAETRTLEDIRLCICGVPIDIVNAQYNPSITHPGGDADSGVFVEAPKGSNELCDEELQLIGRGRVNPMVGGVSVGTVTGQAGTLSTVVWDRTDGTACGLSNWHVLAGRPTAQVGQPTYQPALFDGGTQDDVVGHLKRWHLGEEGDAALTELIGNRHYASGEVLGLWHPLSGCLRPKLNMEIRKWGRTTGFTEGFVDGVHLATNIDYGNEVVRNFRNQFHIAPLYVGQDVSQSGDSGSLVVTSFAPLEQQNQLVTLIDWLQRCCDSKGYRSLCEDVKCQLKKWVEHLKAEDCEEPCQKDLYDFLVSVQATVVSFCGNAPAPTEPPETCCCVREPCCGTKTEGTSEQKPCPCCKASTKALGGSEEEPRLAAIQSCPCCYLKAVREDLRSSYCSRITEDLEYLRRWEQRTETLLRKCREGDFGVERVYKLLFEAAGCRRVNYALQAPIHLNSVTCCDELERLYLWVSCCRVRVEKCSRLCVEVSESLEGWWVKCCAILAAVDESKKICDALYSCTKDRQCKEGPEIVKCIEEYLEDSERQWRDSCRCEPNVDGTKSRPKTPIKDPYLSHRQFLEGESVKYGDLNSNERKNHWFRRLQRKDLEISMAIELDESGLDWFEQILVEKLSTREVRQAILAKARKHIKEQADKDARESPRAYYAVGMIFAGDTPGSPFGEFAIASDIQRLADTLRFSLRPVFEPRSSFRELRVRPPGRQQRLGGQFGGSGGLIPGDQTADPRGGGPQPDVEPLSTNPGDRPSGNGGG